MRLWQEQRDRLVSYFSQAHVCSSLQLTAAELGSGSKQTHRQASLGRKGYKQQRLDSYFRCTNMQWPSNPALQQQAQLYFHCAQPQIKTNGKYLLTPWYGTQGDCQIDWD